MLPSKDALKAISIKKDIREDVANKSVSFCVDTSRLRSSLLLIQSNLKCSYKKYMEVRQVDKYFKYLAVLDKSNRKHNLSNDERLLLDVVATALHDGKVVYVKDLITLNHIASQATLHKALSSLVDKKLLELKITKEDGRLKEVHLTKLANKRYEELSKAIENAVKSK